jgi:hypothetical protein
VEHDGRGVEMEQSAGEARRCRVRVEEREQSLQREWMRIVDPSIVAGSAGAAADNTGY